MHGAFAAARIQNFVGRRELNSKRAKRNVDQRQRGRKARR